VSLRYVYFKKIILRSKIQLFYILSFKFYFFMLPTGHFAAGYLTSTFTLSSLINLYPAVNDPKFLALGLFASVAPDLDEFYAFYVAKGFWFKKKDKAIIHRNYLSHAPLLHLFVGLASFVVGLVANSSDLQLYAILYIVGTWTHFFFDSFFYGVKWLWPFSNNLYAFRKPGEDMAKIEASGFFSYWIGFLKLYVRDLVFYLEALVIVVAVSAYLY